MDDERDNVETSMEVELVADGTSLAVLGKETAVERFVAQLTGTPGSKAASATLDLGAAISRLGSTIAAESGRWVHLTAESAQKVRDFGGFMPTDADGVSYAMLGQPGDIASWIKIEDAAGSLLTNPAVLTGVAGVMTQLAMQQQMQVITDYLEVIDEKLDSVLRSQTNQALARLDGVALAVREAMSVRDAVGRVSEITWSKIQASTQSIHETQGYALRQLKDLADKVDESRKVDELTDTVREIEADIQTWLTVLATCFELHDAVAVIELDRVLDASPDELDQHRVGLRTARAERLSLIGERTAQLLERMGLATEMANSKVLFNPVQSPAIVTSANHVVEGVLEFRQVLALDGGHDAFETRRWTDAASDTWDDARRMSARGVGDVRRFGEKTLSRTAALRKRLTKRNSDENTSE